MRVPTPNDLSRGRWLPALASIAVVAFLVVPTAQSAGDGAPFASIVPGPTVEFPNETDSNSPAVWEMVRGQWRLSLFNSVAGSTQLSVGRNVQQLADAGAVGFSTAPPEGGVWFESVIRDADAWYGFYHNERQDVVCPGSGKVWPRIGAARSEDRGRTWVDLGPIIETPQATTRCTTVNRYFVGGAGDFSVVLDPSRTFAYIYYTQYVEEEGRTGVSVARMLWADRDAPAGRVDVWSDGGWLPPALIETAPSDPPSAERPEVATGQAGPGAGAAPGWLFPLASPLMVAGDRWDDGDNRVNVFWGPSIHWNTHLDSYVMLLNQATSNEWKQGGVFVSFNARIDDPGGWTPPERILEGGTWYPQVMGFTDGQGTDTVAGPSARFFMSGKSDYTIVFGRR
jgi:hypothetical protein